MEPGQSDQTSLSLKMIREHNYDPHSNVVMTAQIAQYVANYCGVTTPGYSGEATKNHDAPIENAINWATLEPTSQAGGPVPTAEGWTPAPDDVRRAAIKERLDVPCDASGPDSICFSGFEELIMRGLDYEEVTLIQDQLNLYSQTISPTAIRTVTATPDIVMDGAGTGEFTHHCQLIINGAVSGKLDVHRALGITQLDLAIPEDTPMVTIYP